MQTRELVTLQRDCEAILIPAGDKVTLKKGHEVIITQQLGNSFTVFIHGNLVRVEGRDADALGKVVIPDDQLHPPAATDQPLDEQLIWEQLKSCYDPEIPVNIVDLGLVYDLSMTPLADGGNQVEIKMTLTAPGCGMGASIADDVKQRVLAVPGVAEANVELVWEPIWNQHMMSEAAQLQLGML